MNKIDEYRFFLISKVIFALALIVFSVIVLVYIQSFGVFMLGLANLWMGFYILIRVRYEKK